MNVLALGLYAEGTTDHLFLSSVIQRTTQKLMLQHEQINTDPSVIVIQLTADQKKDRQESILQAARDASGYHVLIIHADADDPEPHRARVERIEPGLKLVQKAQEDVCKDLVPIIPVQAIEAWILADYELLLSEIETNLSSHNLGIPEKAKQVEKISKPKQRLEEAVRKAYANRPKRQQEADIYFLYQPMGEKISLERLNQVPSYQQFVNELTEMLKKLNVIR